MYGTGAPRTSVTILLPIHELIALDPFPGIQFDDRSHQYPLLVGAARVDGECAAELDRALALMDVAVQRQQRLVPVDRLPNGRRPNRPPGPAAVHGPEVLLGGRRFIELGAIRR